MTFSRGRSHRLGGADCLRDSYEHMMNEHINDEYAMMDYEREQRELKSGQAELYIPDVLRAFVQNGGQATRRHEIAHERKRLMRDHAYWHFWCAQGAWLEPLM